MGRKRGRTDGGYEDQFGDAMRSQDRGDLSFAPSKSGSNFSGGGEAGSGRKDRDVHLVRNVPKFLQGHIHLLGRKPPQEQEEEAQLATVEEAMADKHAAEESEEQEDFVKALRDNPALADQYPELGPLANQALAAEAREAGNQAFSGKQYDAAVQHFTKAISLHPNPIFYSNRAAAYHALKQYKKAVEDATQVVALDPGWVKGWMRLAAAHFALEEWSEAKDAYDKALQLEPDDTAVQSMRHKAVVNEAKEETSRVIKFKTTRQPSSVKASSSKMSQQSAPRSCKNLLSFTDE